MVKLWDTKLVKLRGELNIHSIVKKIGEKADEVDVKENIESQMHRVMGLEDTIV